MSPLKRSFSILLIDTSSGSSYAFLAAKVRGPFTTKFDDGCDVTEMDGGKP